MITYGHSLRQMPIEALILQLFFHNIRYSMWTLLDLLDYFHSKIVKLGTRALVSKIKKLVNLNWWPTIKTRNTLAWFKTDYLFLGVTNIGLVQNSKGLTNEFGLLQPVTSKFESPWTFGSKSAEKIFLDNFILIFDEKLNQFCCAMTTIYGRREFSNKYHDKINYADSLSSLAIDWFQI